LGRQRCRIRIEVDMRQWPMVAPTVKQIF